MRLAAYPLGLFTLLALAGCREERARPQTVVLMLWDTVRADRTSAYGYEMDTTPSLAELAEKGALFEQCQASAPWTVPSVASLFTGLYPTEHGATIEGSFPGKHLPNPTYFGFDETLPTLAQRFRESGYRTYARIANRLLGLDCFKNGFDEIEVEKSSAEGLVDWAIDRLESAGEAPVFLYLHAMDAHVPLQPPQELVARFGGSTVDADALAVAERWGDYKKRVDDLEDPDFQAFLDAKRVLYDASLAHLDSQLGRLRRELDRLGRSDALVCVTADHGEEFWDHPRLQADCYDVSLKSFAGCSHGHTLFEELLRVPLVLAGPGVPVGRIPERVRLLDLGATLMELAGLPRSPLGESRSLGPLLRGGAPPVDEFLAESLSRGNELKALVDGDGYKWIQATSETERSLLFHLPSDPRETRDLLSTEPERASVLRRRLEDALAQRANLGRRGQAAGPEALEDLRDLGYTGN